MFGIQKLINYFYPLQELSKEPPYILKCPDPAQQPILLNSQEKKPMSLNKKGIKIYKLELSKKKLNKLIKTADNAFFLEFHKRQLEEVSKKLYALEDKMPKQLPIAQKPIPEPPKLLTPPIQPNSPLKPLQPAQQKTHSLDQLIGTEFQSLISQHQEITIVESTTKKTWKISTKFLPKTLKTALQQLSSDLPYYLVTTKGNKWMITLPADDLSEIHICFDKDNPTVIGITASKENQDAIPFFFKKALENSKEEISSIEKTEPKSEIVNPQSLPISEKEAQPPENQEKTEGIPHNEFDVTGSKKSHHSWNLQQIVKITVVAVLILAIFVATPLIIHAIYGFSAVVILGISLPYFWFPIIGGAIPLVCGGLGFSGYKASQAIKQKLV